MRNGTVAQVLLDVDEAKNVMDLGSLGVTVEQFERGRFGLVQFGVLNKRPDLAHPRWNGVMSRGEVHCPFHLYRRSEISQPPLSNTATAQFQADYLQLAILLRHCAVKQRVFDPPNS